MSVILTTSERVEVLGRTINLASSVSADGGTLKEKTVPAAKTGQLTTRTDADTGTLTMDSGHGITTGARLDVYWSGGARRGMTVGTVSSNSVPIDGGDGDDLPDNLTSITAMVPVEESLPAVGDNVSAIVLSSDLNGTIVLADSNDAELAAQRVGGDYPKAYVWTSYRDPVNPIAGDTVDSVFFSHGDATQSATMRAALLFD